MIYKVLLALTHELLFIHEALYLKRDELYVQKTFVEFMKYYITNNKKRDFTTIGPGLWPRKNKLEEKPLSKQLHIWRPC